MQGIDTNVLLRYLLKDDAEQASRAIDVIHAAVNRGESLFLAGIVLCEMVWVLESGYKQERSDIADLLDRLLLTHDFEFEHRDLVAHAVSGYRSGPGDFADLLIGQINQKQGCSRTLTLDRALRGTPGFEIV